MSKTPERHCDICGKPEKVDNKKSADLYIMKIVGGKRFATEFTYCEECLDINYVDFGSIMVPLKVQK